MYDKITMIVNPSSGMLSCLKLAEYIKNRINGKKFQKNNKSRQLG